MIKRIVSLVLCLGMLAGILLMTSCGQTTPGEDTGTLPGTINLIGITGETTTPEAIKAVENALNRISKARYKTQINLTLVTADEYIALIDEKIAEAEQRKVELAAIKKYNEYAIKQANELERIQASQKKSISKWTKKVSGVIADTISTGKAYDNEETTIYDDGRIETLYPDATSPIDIVMIDGKDMYDYLDSKGVLLSIKSSLSGSTYSKFRQYIYPAFFEQLEAITGDIKAIPNNNLIAEYTYLVVDKALADKYDFDVDMVENYKDLDDGENGFLSQIKTNESVIPFATVPDALGIYQYFDGEIPVGTYFDPIYGYSTSEGTDFKIQNLFDIPEYRAHLTLMDTYTKNGYFESASGSQNFAVTVIKGDASVAEIYGDDYYVKVIQNPFVEEAAIFDGMLAVSSYTSSEERSLQVIEMINTDSDVKNLLQYGIAYNGDNDDIANYRVNTIVDETGATSYSITRLNQNYMMDNTLTGNVYMGYPEEGQIVDAWTYYKQTNLDSSLSPFMHFYLSDSDFDKMTNTFIRRAALSEAFAPVGFTYDEYELNTPDTSAGSALRRRFKLYYIERFMEALSKEDVSFRPFTIITNNTSNALRDDFIKYMISAEGQQTLKEIGYLPTVKNPQPYTKSSQNFSGTLRLCARVHNDTRSYIESALTALIDSYTEMYPDVTIEMPVKQNDTYTADMTTVHRGTYDIGFLGGEMLSSEAALNLPTVDCAKECLTVFLSTQNATYSYTWYENLIINEFKAEKYANVVSNSELQTLVNEKLAELAKAGKYSNYDSARKNAYTPSRVTGYYTNIAYLRVMAEIRLWNDLSEEELETYRVMNDIAFENAVFEYVRANYEKEHGLTDEEYRKLIQDYMVSVLIYYTGTDTTSTYAISWDEFQQTKKDAQTYLTAATAIKDVYYDKLVAKYGATLTNLFSLTESIDEIYEIMYSEYLTENGLTKTEFENSVKDQFLSAVGTNAEEFASYRITSDEYKNYVSKLRKKYKSILVDAYSSEVYKKGESGISNANVVSTIFNHFLEEKLGIYDRMCEIAGIDYEDFVESKSKLADYEKYLGTMQTSFLYTLRTKYTQNQINSWSYEELEANLFNVLYETGFYTGEMAKTIGLALSEYMNAKSQAVTYQGYLSNLVNALAPEIKALGYDVDTFALSDPEEIECVCEEIIRAKYYSDKITIKDVLVDISGDYMTGLENAADIDAYFDEASKALSENYFFMAVVDSLEASWEENK